MRVLEATLLLLCTTTSLGRLQKPNLRRRAQDVEHDEADRFAEGGDTPGYYDQPPPGSTLGLPGDDFEAADREDRNGGGKYGRNRKQWNGGNNGNQEEEDGPDKSLYIEYKGDVIRREGLGESPGLTALEYLGTGYNYLEGNPRGSEGSELDPGFRASVIQLMQVQTDLTIDQEFTVPLGTELRYLTSCQFSSTSTELSTTSDYTNQLSTESKLSGSAGLSLGIGAFSFGASVAFSRSERYRSFVNTRQNTLQTSFESRAICTEFEGRLLNYHTHVLTAPFQTAIESLPRTFNQTEEEETNAFELFLNEYGTHYINRVVLGAKQIHTTIMNSQDVLTLRENQVDVSRTLSAKVMFGYNDDGSDSSSPSVNGNTGNNNLFNFVQQSGVDADTDSGNSGSITGEVTSETSTSELERSLSEIRAVVTEVREVNIGGTPPSEEGDWREWAATVNERPMPVIYELTPLFEAMDDELIVAYSEALEYLYSRPEEEDEGETVRMALNLGVAEPNGDPISTYTVEPLEDYRTLTILNEPETRLENQTEEACIDGGTNPFFRYDVLWQGSEQAESAVFASLIRDNLAPNTKEDKLELGIFDNRFDDELALRNSLYAFGLSNEPSRSTIAVFEQTNLGSVNELNSFTYLTADNVPDTEEIVVGVVHPQGYAINEVFCEDLGFEIAMENDREFVIKFTRNFTDIPTFIVSPMWFPTDDQRYPCNVGEIQVGLRDCTQSECRVQVGALQQFAEEGVYDTLFGSQEIADFYDNNANVSPFVTSNPFNPLFGLANFARARQVEGADFTEVDTFNTDQFLGFSFMAVDQSLPSGSLFNSTLGIVHGQITIVTDRTDTNVTTDPGTLMLNYSLTQEGQGFTATPFFSYTDPFSLSIGDKNLDVTNQVVGGVQIDFDEQFLGLPTVFASPITGDFEYSRSEITDLTIEKVRGGLLSFLFPKTKVVAREVEALEIPSTIVEHITKSSTFIKAGLVSTSYEEVFRPGDGELPSIYTPVSFHFVAIGPVAKTPVADSIFSTT